MTQHANLLTLGVIVTVLMTGWTAHGETGARKEGDFQFNIILDGRKPRPPAPSSTWKGDGSGPSGPGIGIDLKLRVGSGEPSAPQRGKPGGGRDGSRNSTGDQKTKADQDGKHSGGSTVTGDEGKTGPGRPSADKKDNANTASAGQAGCDDAERRSGKQRDDPKGDVDKDSSGKRSHECDDDRPRALPSYSVDPGKSDERAEEAHKKAEKETQSGLEAVNKNLDDAEKRLGATPKTYEDEDTDNSYLQPIPPVK